MEPRHLAIAIAPSSPGWPEGHYAVLTFLLRHEDQGTALVTFAQNVPEAVTSPVENLLAEYHTQLSGTPRPDGQ